MSLVNDFLAAVFLMVLGVSAVWLWTTGQLRDT